MMDTHRVWNEDCKSPVVFEEGQLLFQFCCGVSAGILHTISQYVEQEGMVTIQRGSLPKIGDSLHCGIDECSLTTCTIVLGYGRKSKDILVVEDTVDTL